MASRSNKVSRSMAPANIPSSKNPRSFGTPTGYSPPARVQMGRPTVGPGTQQQMRSAITADQQAATAGAKKFAVQRATRLTQQNPGMQPAQNLGLSAVNAARTIKKKQAGDKRYIDLASQ